MDSSTPAEQAYAEDVTDLHEVQRMIAQLRCVVRQDTELAYDFDFVPLLRQRRALPGVRG